MRFRVAHTEDIARALRFERVSALRDDCKGWSALVLTLSRVRLQVTQATASDCVATLNTLLHHGPDAVADVSARVAEATASLRNAQRPTVSHGRGVAAPPWLEVPSLAAISSEVQRQGELSMRATEALLRVSLTGRSSAHASTREGRDKAPFEDCTASGEQVDGVRVPIGPEAECSSKGDSADTAVGGQTGDQRAMQATCAAEDGHDALATQHHDSWVGIAVGPDVANGNAEASRCI